jgi:peptidoglycan/LPS O-acetylase OafA/YrhL
MSVVLFHYAFSGPEVYGSIKSASPLVAPVAKYGYLGVELFFMISGFVILMSASKGGVLQFVRSRVVRLYPAFWVCCTITAALLTLSHAIGEPIGIGQYVINMTMGSEFLHFLPGSSMLKVAPIDGVYWSLFVEIKFYLLVTMVLLLKKISIMKILLALWLALSVVLQFWTIYMLRYLFIADYSAYFIAGSMLYYIWQEGAERNTVIMLICAWVLALYQSLSSVPNFSAIFKTQVNPWVVATVITAFFLGMLFIAIKKNGFLNHPFPWTLIGATTYPLYLIHQNVGILLMNALHPTLNRHLILWGVVCSMILIAMAINLYLEKPMMHWLNQRLKSILKS